MAALGLHCCSWASLVIASEGHSLVAARGLFIAAAALVWSTGSRAQATVLVVAPQHVASSQTRD